ncbi:MAG: 4-phosphoerythronate dehydrogenase [Rikenellaceae bacterium]
MKVIVDKAIPFIEGALEPHAEVEYIDGTEFSAARVEDADILIVRTRTRCDKALLEGSAVKHIATATIGFDHIDLEYCKSRGISISTAAGCNARGVLHWLAAALVALAGEEGFAPKDRTLGIVGVGNVGSLVKEHAEHWGFKVLCCDPERQAADPSLGFVSLEELAQKADIITLHTPLSKETYHMIGSKILGGAARGKTIINSSRGEVIDGKALLDSNSRYILDVWENEPNINRDLLAGATRATYHIAGYTLQGKVAATRMSLEAVAERFSLDIKIPDCGAKQQTKRSLDWNELCATIKKHIDLEAESYLLRSHAEEFEQLRSKYIYREEYF